MWFNSIIENESDQLDYGQSVQDHKLINKDLRVYFLYRKNRGKEKIMCEKLLDVIVEDFDEEQARAELGEMEEQFVDKMTDGIGEDIGEVIPDPYEEEEEEL